MVCLSSYVSFEMEKPSWAPGYSNFKGLSSISCEINTVVFDIHCLTNGVDSGDSSLSAYEEGCFALLYHLCSGSKFF